MAALLYMRSLKKFPAGISLINSLNIPYCSWYRNRMLRCLLHSRIKKGNQIKVRVITPDLGLHTCES